MPRPADPADRTAASLAHLSDVHLPVPDAVPLSALLNKRALSLLSWRRKRRHLHRPEVLARLVADLRKAAPDRVAVTGDLTNLGLESEYRAARLWLDALGDPAQVMVIPGNHEALVPGAWPRGAEHWRPYWQGDDAGTGNPVNGFPWLRRCGPMALIGVSSAIPSLPARAVGKVGAAQLGRLEALLVRAGEAGLCRVVMVHHPPIDGTVRARKRLLDAGALRAVLVRAGVEIVLHGHSHRSHHQVLETREGPAPVIGVPSASATYPEAAAYHLYRITEDVGGWHVTLQVRRHGPDKRMEEGQCANMEIARGHARR